MTTKTEHFDIYDNEYDVRINQYGRYEVRVKNVLAQKWVGLASFSEMELAQNYLAVYMDGRS